MSVASWVCIGLMLMLFFVLWAANWYADRYRDEREENKRLRSLLEVLGCSEYPIMRLVPLQSKQDRVKGS